MNYEYKIWIIENNIKVFGIGPMMLLAKTKEFGSLRKASNDMNMSYTKALKIVKNIESNLNIKILKRSSGGLGGGGSHLTVEAENLIEKFEKFNSEVEKAINQIYIKNFE
ncbi:winged helix-turn-helix domain-containing protein [Helicovermis profundi]|uniref:Uncharacterized protein n=1 Tax=Helicovermis profundi TaxID=3065157 RepID=A0AAU9EEI6_9FIRM|nr:hypothetical protein HLPR_21850 [Clostridia bacterium S502]